jgi:hypothetical protein
VRGAKAFLISVGVVVLFLGVLVLLALPAADVMDRKAAIEDGIEQTTARREGITIGGVASLLAGGALVAWGLILKQR